MGAILNSHPEIAYRFEPFSRLRGHPAIQQAIGIINSEEFSDKDMGLIYDQLVCSYPMTDKPPFFPKSHSRYRGKAIAWPLCRRIPALQPAYIRWYSPRRGAPPLIFKEVAQVKLMERLQKQAAMRSLYLVRHPCALVASMVRGQTLDLMPLDRFDVLDNLLRAHDPELADKVVPQLGGLSPAAKNALLWRIDVERGVRTVRETQNGHIMIYENLCRDPHQGAEEALAFFGLDMDRRVREFVEESIGGNWASRWKFGELGGSQYFSVVRNPLLTMDKWKSQLSARDEEDVRRHVEDSEIYQYCAKLGDWD